MTAIRYQQTSNDDRDKERRNSQADGESPNERPQNGPPMKDRTTSNPIAGWTQCIPIKSPTMPMPPTTTTTTTATSAITSSRKRVFDSVFLGAAPKSDHVSVDPLAGGTGRKRQSKPDTEGNEDRAWHAATTFLVVPDRGLEELMGAFEGVSEEEFLKRWNRHGAPAKKTADALTYLVSRESSSGSSGTVEHGGIINWYGREIRRHFLKNFRDGLHGLLNQSEKEGLLQTIVRCLQLARRIYFAPLVEYVLPLLDAAEQEKVFVKLHRTFHHMVAYSSALPWDGISALLSREFTKEALIILGIDALKEEAARDDDSEVDDMELDRQFTVSYRQWFQEPSVEARMEMMTEEDPQVTAARDRLLSLLDGLQLVGLGGDKAQKVFASVMNSMMIEFVLAAYPGQWEGPSLVSQHLRHWVENVFARLVVQVLAIINVPESGSKNISSDHLDVNLTDVEKWYETGYTYVGTLRMRELFDMIVEWPASSGAIDDLRRFTTNPATRLYFTLSFASVLGDRLLHPGASTVEILQLYISIIRALNLLDPKGVLLDRVARPIRRYLRDRDDTVKVIVGGLLADPTDSDGQPTQSTGDTLGELSAELTKAHQTSLQNEGGELDWDDMNWMPDPVDAAPDFRKSKTADVIGSLISLFESKEMFVREMQNMLADRLLQTRADYEQEMSVLELLKVRFGDNALQACEVMLRDIFDSRRVDQVIRNDQGLTQVAADQQPNPSSDLPDLHAKILSHFFWPDIQEQEFKVPHEISTIQNRYATGFESLKASRRLTWLNGLGQVTVELDLEDRVFVDEVTTWQAAVIHAFQSTSNEPITKTLADLSEDLQMSPSLARSACLFWISKRILTEVARETYRVLEVLPATEDPNETSGLGTTAASGSNDDAGGGGSATAAAEAEAAAATAAKESANAAAMEKMNLYWQFIVGMLTNQGAMPLPRIVMMLKIAVPGGFPFSNEELREFLAGMVAKGKLEIVAGGSYKIVN